MGAVAPWSMERTAEYLLETSYCAYEDLPVLSDLLNGVKWKDTLNKKKRESLIHEICDTLTFYHIPYSTQDQHWDGPFHEFRDWSIHKKYYSEEEHENTMMFRVDTRFE